MRPVLADKGGRGAYPYRLGSDLTKVRMTFGSDNAKAAIALFGREDPTYAELLDNWVWYAKWYEGQLGNNMPNDINERVRLAKAMGNRIGEIYRKAATPLVEQLGAFCSYCGIVLPATIAVEHITPKSEYPQFSLAWENLLIACGPCNGKSAKSDRPARSYVVDNWLNGRQPAEEKDYYDTIRNHYVWPDKDDKSYRKLIPHLEYFSQSQSVWKRIPNQWSVKLDMRFVSESIQRREVTASIHVSHGDMAHRLVRVMIEDSGAQSSEMVELCKLNSDGSTKDEGTSDRRLMERTKQWFSILQQLDLLNQVRREIFDVAWQQLIATARNSGFYSLWVKILDLTKMKNPETGSPLVDDFVRETNVPYLYPNTNTSQIP